MNLNKIDFIKDFIETIWNQAEIHKVKDFIYPNYKIFHDPGDPFEGQTLNHERFIVRLKKSREILKDLKFKCIDSYELKNQVILTWEFDAIYSVTNKVLKNISGITIYYFENEMISGHWQEFDRLGMIEKIKS